MIRRRLYLHLGVHRTGSSAIQHVMAAQFGALLSQGVFHPYAVARHDHLFNDIFSGIRSADEVARDITARADAKPVPIDRITLSDEDIICRRDLTPLAPLADHFDLHAILFLRRQDLWLESWYRQNIKWQWDRDLAQADFDQFLAQRHRFFWIDYEKLVARLERIIAPEALHIVVLDPTASAQDSVAEFLQIVGAAVPHTPAEQTRVNAALSPQMTEFMRQFPLKDLAAPERRIIEAACAKVDRYTPIAQAAYLDPTQRAEIMAGYAGGNRRLAERFFGRAELFFNPASDPVQDGRPPVSLRYLPKDRTDILQQLVWPVLQELARVQMKSDGGAA